MDLKKKTPTKPQSSMIEQIFDLLMKEARERSGNDLVARIYNVSMELDGKIIDKMAVIRTAEREKGK